MIFILFLMPVTTYGQSQEKIYMHKGNKEYLQKNYAAAETYYRKALEKNAQNSRARYNLGNTLLFQQKPKEAMQEYEKAAPLEKNPNYKASIYHNMGVILQSQKQFGPAIECYKESLRNKDKDKDKKDDKQKQQEKQNQQSDPNKDQKQDKPKGQKNEMSKDNADQMLRAAQMKENRTQDKVRKAQLHSNRKQMENNW